MTNRSGLDDTLALNAMDYDSGRSRRPQADPLGMRGLPRHRAGLDVLVTQLCERLELRSPRAISGGDLARALGLEGTRALRLLCAYARIHHGRHEIVGKPGEGYSWLPSQEDQAAAARAARRMARCWLYLATLHGRQGVAMGAVNTLFDMMEFGGAERHSDDLSALLASDGSSIADALEAFIQRLAQTDEGRRVISDVVSRNREIVLSEAVVEELLGQVDKLRGQIVAAVRRAG